MANRNFDTIRDEVMTRLGRSGVTAMESRVEEWVTACWLEICQLYYHHELAVEPAATETLSADSDNFSLPNDTYLVFGVALKDGSTLKGRLGWMRPMNLFGRRTTTAGLPQHYTRYNSKVYVERPADQEYTAEIYYYRQATDPDYDTPNATDVDPLFDEVLVEWATARGQGALWRPDLAQYGYQTLQQFWSRVANPPLAAGVQRDRDDEDVSGVPYAEALG